MNKISAILVDDEINARENLRILLNNFCSNIDVLGEATNVDEAVLAIRKHQPQIVFLDIEMPQKNGFQLLEEFDEINFHVIFVTAYDSYAIKAFQVTAVDYLLKPIDVSLLEKAIKKAEKYIEKNTQDSRINLLKENKKEITKIAIPYKSDYAIVNIKDILCIEADRMYSVIYTVKGKEFVVAKKLNYYETLFSEKRVFIRIHRSWIVNVNQIDTYSKKEKEVVLSTKFKVPVSKSYKENFEQIFYI
ncbi:DNA-binding response regulator [Tenacibaculum sp. Bg11-29]|uniref:LytR/AlgR family response regulator transcription factor n=1 Tax=Tenacibaculum sp. Bg11-29 TaxID=2058306 RepID=UPI000C327AE0|nr:response regulator [Tenacibaculum sp. Bg11-29]PKH50981.1 DNA-binding response regulator [Tenacibaculum sp. Bg11-29]